ncbi:CDP-alcohol phosphatidyltransferase family protein [Halomarina oriensis]|uniref:CDP-alcohol phosphatidyltransferase family protein n=1 Tax=Halomarina oriensis TaxID=671145 RepID=A0A6B0GMT7_9EURY|nr:CDP-alcohol phosphatidyltransferase family protein [Halomarina oriensis]MWG34023.1 CDP-alcohol phosphatidyltransferase family protein [Halomarina oriensis]
MTLDQFRPVANRLLAPFVDASERLGLTPNAVSVAAIALAAAAGVAFAFGRAFPILYLAGSFLVFLNGWLDILDGALARRLNVASPAGDLLDHVLDRYADIFILVGLAAGVGQWALGLAAVTGVVMTSYLGTQAQAVGLDRVYGGLVGRADRLVIVGVVGVVAWQYTDAVAGLTVVGWALVFFAVVGHVTALQRFYSAMQAFGARDRL